MVLCEITLEYPKTREKVISFHLWLLRILPIPSYLTNTSKDVLTVYSISHIKTSDNLLIVLFFDIKFEMITYNTTFNKFILKY